MDIPFDTAVWAGPVGTFAVFVPASGGANAYILILETNYYNLFGTLNYGGSAGGSSRTCYAVISPGDLPNAPEPVGTIQPPITVGGPPAPTEVECVGSAVPLTIGDKLRPRASQDSGADIDMLVTPYTPVFTIERAV